MKNLFRIKRQRNRMENAVSNEVYYDQLHKTHKNGSYKAFYSQSNETDNAGGPVKIRD